MLEDGRDLGSGASGPAESSAHAADPPSKSPGEGVGRVGHELEQTVQPGDHGQFNDESGRRVTESGSELNSSDRPGRASDPGEFGPARSHP